jgi:GGDEF domain-containing protein
MTLAALAGVGAMSWAAITFPVGKVDYGLLVLAPIIVLLSSNLRIQLLRKKIFFTVSDALIFLTLLWYGGQIALLIAVFESGLASWNLRRDGIHVKSLTAIFNIFVAACATFATNQILLLLYPNSEAALAESDISRFAMMIVAVSLAQFCVNSLMVSVYVSITNRIAIWNVWNKYCLTVLAMVVSGGIMAGFSGRAIQNSNILLFVSVAALFGVVYLTIRRYANDVKKTTEKAEDAERQRARQAEQHLEELQHYVSELEKSGQALRESREKFRLAAYHDILTGLPNRNKFIEVLNGLIKADKPSRSKFAVLFLDLDRFKTVNDSLGHSSGDELIRQVGYRLSGLMLSSNGLVGRFSGDEFGMLLTDLSSSVAATELAEKSWPRRSRAK